MRKTKKIIKLLATLLLLAGAGLFAGNKIIKLVDALKHSSKTIQGMVDEIPQLKVPMSEKLKGISVEKTIKVGLTEEIGVPCISVTLIEGSKNNFVGDAKLEDGREFNITATTEGDRVRYYSILKPGYEYKCKHHINQITLRINDGTLSGKVWNDESHPISGFVAIEFIDKNDKVYFVGCEPVYESIGEKLWVFLQPFEWIPTGDSFVFSYKEQAILFSNLASIKIEFFNLGDYDPGFDRSGRSINYNQNLLKSIPVKVTTKKIPIANINIEKST